MAVATVTTTTTTNDTITNVKQTNKQINGNDILCRKVYLFLVDAITTRRMRQLFLEETFFSL